MTGPGVGEIRITVDVAGAHYTARDRHVGGVSASDVLVALPHLVRQLEGSLERLAQLEEVRNGDRVQVDGVGR